MPNKNKKPAKKPTSKAKPVKVAAAKAKTPTKTAAKPASKASKAAPQKGGLVKAMANTVGKLLGKDKDTEKSEAKGNGTAKKAALIPADTKAAPKKDKAAKKDKKKKAGKEGLDLEEDDLLASDEEMGSEEIPDLSEFDEAETEEADIEEDAALEESAVAADLKPSDDEIVLTDAEGRRYCRVRDCDQISAVEGYCRFHYLLLWKKIQVRRKILADGKLERYVEELTSRYPDKFLEMIRKDLRTEKDFLAAIAELEIDESAGDNEFEDETQSYVDEIRGMTTDTGMSEEEEF